eukprot:2994797-Rhodomonas_salina.1
MPELSASSAPEKPPSLSDKSVSLFQKSLSLIKNCGTRLSALVADILVLLSGTTTTSYSSVPVLIWRSICTIQGVSARAGTNLSTHVGQDAA